MPSGLTILQVPPPSPLKHNKQSQTGYGLTTEVNLNGIIGKVSGELEGTRWKRDTDSGGNGGRGVPALGGLSSFKVTSQHPFADSLPATDLIT